MENEIGAETSLVDLLDAMDTEDQAESGGQEYTPEQEAAAREEAQRAMNRQPKAPAPKRNTNTGVSKSEFAEMKSQIDALTQALGEKNSVIEGVQKRQSDTEMHTIHEQIQDEFKALASNETTYGNEFVKGLIKLDELMPEVQKEIARKMNEERRFINPKEQMAISSVPILMKEIIRLKKQEANANAFMGSSGDTGDFDGKDYDFTTEDGIRKAQMQELKKLK